MKDINDTIVLDCKFLPFKPINSKVYIILDKVGGGRYKYELILESKEPEEDDILVLESSMNKATAIKFKLRNVIE